MAAPAPARAVAEMSDRLRALARPSGAFDARRYFRATGRFAFLNVGTPRVRALARALHGRQRDRWTLAHAAAFADRAIRDPRLEVKAVGIELLTRYRRQFRPSLLPAWKRWLSAGYAANWATTDAICGSLIGPLLVMHPALAVRVAAWSGDRGLWVRRASAVALIPLVRTGRRLDLAYRVARALEDDREDLIQKAAGWLLREAGKADARRLERYLRANGARVPRTTMRYAIERFPPATRRALLADTRRLVD
jgi:3-methyladenine DNA glycosylase AlkD